MHSLWNRPLAKSKSGAVTWPCLNVSSSMWRNTKLNPDTIKGYQALTAAGQNTNLLGPKTRELISLAVAVTVRYDGCIAVHAEAAARHRASRVEIAEVLGVATTVNAGAALVYSSWTPMSRSPLRHDPPRPLARPHSGRAAKLRAHAEVCIDRRTGAGTWARLSEPAPVVHERVDACGHAISTTHPDPGRIVNRKPCNFTMAATRLRPRPRPDVWFTLSDR